MSNTLRYILIVLAGAWIVWYAFIRKEHPGGGTRMVQEQPAPTNGRAAERLFHVVTPRTAQRSGLDAEISTRSGGVRGLRLAGEQFRQRTPRPDPPTCRFAHDGRMNLQRTCVEEFLPLRTRLEVRRNGTSVVPTFLDYTARSSTERGVELVWRGGDVEVVRTVTAEKPFALRVVTRVTNHGAPATVDFQLPLYHWVSRDEESGGFFRQSWEVAEGMCRHGDELYREGRDKLLERNARDPLPGTARFVGLGNLYFVSALVAPPDAQTTCRLHAEDRPNADDPVGTVYSASLDYAPRALATGQSHAFEATAFFGPKKTEVLAAVDSSLTDAVNLGFFALIARFLVRFLQFLYRLIPNWGVAIILLTVCVRIALYPILARSTKSLAMMQKLKPELDAINELYKDNQEQKGMATMELYRRHGINPLSGCLPQLAQLPIWWALYTTLQTSVELFHAPFVLWWRDLSAPDPFYVLPLVLGAIMFLQQKMMPPQAMDPTQAKIMMYFMPIFLTAISLFLPAGLALYMLVNSCLGILQQKLTKMQLDKLAQGTGGGEAIVVKAVAPTPEPSPPGGRRGRSRG